MTSIEPFRIPFRTTYTQARKMFSRIKREFSSTFMPCKLNDHISFNLGRCQSRDHISGANCKKKREVYL